MLVLWNFGLSTDNRLVLRVLLSQTVFNFYIVFPLIHHSFFRTLLLHWMGNNQSMYNALLFRIWYNSSSGERNSISAWFLSRYDGSMGILSPLSTSSIIDQICHKVFRYICWKPQIFNLTLIKDSFVSHTTMNYLLFMNTLFLNLYTVVS